jgi:hypothetical protein
MKRITTVYDKVGFKKTKKGKCAICGKNAQQTEKFYQTLSPWNKKDGHLKTENEILLEEGDKCEAWLEKPLIHKKCKNTG